MTLTAFTGDGSYQIFTNDPISPRKIIPANGEEMTAALERLRQGIYVQKPANPGVIIPIRLVLSKLESASRKSTIIDDVYKTAGISAGGFGLERTITDMKLDVAKYQAHAETMQGAALPPDVQTFFRVFRNPPK